MKVTLKVMPFIYLLFIFISMETTTKNTIINMVEKISITKHCVSTMSTVLAM